MPARAQETDFEAVAEAVFRRHARVWKDGTLRVNQIYFRRQLLPWFAGRQIADISRQDTALIVGVGIVAGLLVALVNLLADVAVIAIDPRVHR